MRQNIFICLITMFLGWAIAVPSQAQTFPPTAQRIDAALGALQDIIVPLQASLPSPEEERAMADHYTAQVDQLRAQAVAGAITDAAIRQAMTYATALMPPQAQLALGLLSSLGGMMGFRLPSLTEITVNNFMDDLDASGVTAGAMKGQEILKSRDFTAEEFASTLSYIFAGHWQNQGGLPKNEDIDFQMEEDIPLSPTDLMIAALENHYRAQGLSPPGKSLLAAEAKSLLPRAARDAITHSSHLQQALQERK